MNSKFKSALSLLVSFLFTVSVFAQTDEQGDYKNISLIQNKSQRIEATKKFVETYPSGKLLGRAYFDIFNLAASIGDEETAVKYGDLYINLFGEASRMNPYNSVAYTFAEAKIGLKAAKIYAQKAVDMARNASPRALRQILDTQALVYYQLGDADSALILEKEAIIGNEEDPGYLYYLALYENATGHNNDALLHSAQAVFFGDGGNALSKFSEWLKKEKPTEKEQTAIKEKLVKQIVDSYLKGKNDSGASEKKSTAAAFMVKMNVDIKGAEKLAVEAASSINKKTSLDTRLTLSTNLAMVYLASGKTKKALDVLVPISKLASPYDGDFWFTQGQVYEKSGNDTKAMESYIQGLITFENPKIKPLADALVLKNKLGDTYLSDKIATTKNEMINFEPGKFTGKNKSGKVVLAELFTGAECGPCVASDMAFDKLSEYYPKKDVAILEYHLHIPGPDPMTNPDTYKRYVYYGGDFGTPTVFFDGGEKLIGGGASVVSSNRFKVYDHLISQYMQNKPEFNLWGTAKLDNDNSVNLNYSIKKLDSKGKKNLALHFALAEKSISYTGSNGISKHIFVVRDLLNGSEGESFDVSKKESKISHTISLTEVEAGIKTYLDDPTKDKSWRAGSFGGWKERPDTLNTTNLAVVAWIQDNDTKEILQSFYTDVTTNSGTN